MLRILLVATSFATVSARAVSDAPLLVRADGQPACWNTERRISVHVQCDKSLGKETRRNAIESTRTALLTLHKLIPSLRFRFSMSGEEGISVRLIPIPNASPAPDALSYVQTFGLNFYVRAWVRLNVNDFTFDRELLDKTIFNQLCTALGARDGDFETVYWIYSQERGPDESPKQYTLNTVSEALKPGKLDDVR